MQERGRTLGSRWKTGHQLVLRSATILDNMGEALCDLSRGVVEDAVKASDMGKRRNISSVCPKKAVGERKLLEIEAIDQHPDTSGFMFDVGGAGWRGPLTCVWWAFACLCL